MNQTSPPNFPFPVKSLPSLGLSILIRSGEGIKKGQTCGHRTRKAGIRWAKLALVEKPQHLRCLLHRAQQGVGLADLGENVVCRGAVFRLHSGRKLSWAFSTHTANVHTWIRKEGFAISLSLDWEDLAISHGSKHWVLGNGHANGKQ